MKEFMRFTATHHRLTDRNLPNLVMGYVCRRYERTVLRRNEKYSQDKVQLAFKTIQAAFLAAVAVIHQAALMWHCS